MMVVMTMMDGKLHLFHNLRMQAGGVSTACGGRGDDFGEVDGAAAGVLRDLLAATEPVSDEDGLRGGGADGGQQYAFAEGLGDCEFVVFEAERASHAAAAGVEQIDVGTGAAEEGELVGHFHEGFVMAVALDDDFAAGMLGGLEVGGVMDEEFAEEESLTAEALGAGVVGEEIDEFVAKDTGAAGL
jgi:hypothetical protein